jgi:hypothetical protein
MELKIDKHKLKQDKINEWTSTKVLELALIISFKQLSCISILSKFSPTHFMYVLFLLKRFN